MRYCLIAFTISALMAFFGVSVNAIELANALQDDSGKLAAGKSWKDFDFGPRFWTIAGTATQQKKQIKAEIVSLDGTVLLLKEVTSGGIRRVQTTDVSADDRRYLAAYQQAKNQRAEEISKKDDLRVWKISLGDRSKLTARLDRIEGDEVVLQSPEADLRMQFALLPDTDKQFVREELTRRGTEIPDSMKLVKVLNVPPAGREIREWTVRDQGVIQAWVEGVTPTSVHLQQSDPDLGMLQIGFLNLSSNDLEYLREKFPAESQLNVRLCPFCGKGLPTYVGEDDYYTTCPHCERQVVESQQEKALAHSAPLSRHDVQQRLMEARQEAEQQRAEATTDVESVRLSSRSYRGLFKLAIFVVLAVVGCFSAVIVFVVRAVSGNARRNRYR